MTRETDNGESWLDAQGSAKSRSAIVRALQAMGYRVESGDLASITGQIQQIVDEAAQQALAQQLGGVLEAQTGSVPDAPELSGLRSAFDRMAKAQPSDMGQDGMIDERPTRSTRDPHRVTWTHWDKPRPEPTLAVHDVLTWGLKENKPYSRAWEQISRKAPYSDLISGYLQHALDALPEREPNLLERLKTVLLKHSPPPVMKVTVDPVLTRNSGRFLFRYGHAHWKLDYLAGADYLVLIIADDGPVQPLQTQVSTSDPRVFSEDMLKAFHGQAQFARIALESLRETFDTSAINPFDDVRH